jgi:DNA-binding NarL/FixJ family response regulator
MGNTESKITIVIADDHPLFLEGLRHAIETDPGLEILAEATDGRRALKTILRLKPQIAVVDISMPELDGLELARRLVDEESTAAVIFLTMYREKNLLDSALDLGVKGYVLKDSAGTDISKAIHAVAEGKHFVSPALTSYLVEASRKPAKPPVEPGGFDELSPSELRILRLISDYKTSREIANELFISPRTVETHRTHICQKLGLHGSHALMKFALSQKDRLMQTPD